MRLRNYDPLQIPKPDPNFKYFWASTDIRSPQYVGAMKADGYEKVPAKEAESLGFELGSTADGGLVDKTNNRIGTPDLVLMKINRTAFDQRIAEKNSEMLRVVGKKTSEFEENAEKAGVLLRE